MAKFLERNKIVPFIQPASITTLQGGNLNFVSLRDTSYAGIFISTGALVSTAPAVTLQQAKNVEGDGSKALTIPKVWINVPASSPQDEQDLWQENAVVSDTFNLAASTNYWIEVDPQTLDASNNFYCIRPAIAAPGTSLVYSCYIVLYGLRYTGLGKLNQPSATVDDSQFHQ